MNKLFVSFLVFYTFNQCHANLNKLENKIAHELLSTRSSEQSLNKAHSYSIASFTLIHLVGFTVYSLSSNDELKKHIKSNFNLIYKLSLAFNVIFYPADWYLKGQAESKEKTLKEIKEFKANNTSNDIPEFLLFLEKKQSNNSYFFNIRRNYMHIKKVMFCFMLLAISVNIQAETKQEKLHFNLSER